VVTPFLVPFVWWRNRDADPGTPEEDDLVVPAAARWGMGAIGVFMLLSCLISFIAPDVVISFWPWTLSVVTARILGGWFALMGVGGLVMAGESRWSAWRIEVESIIFVWHALVLVGAVWHWEDFKPGAIWFPVAEGAAIVALLALYLIMERRRRA
jgi:hypothetical protein